MGVRRAKKQFKRWAIAATAILFMVGAAPWSVNGQAYAEEVDKKAAKEIVNPYQKYTYDALNQDLKKLAAAYPELIQLKTIGRTSYGREIQAVKLGKGDASILIDGSQHAREWMGANLIMYMIDRYANAYEKNMKYDDYVVRNLLDHCSIWFVPMVNPDGVSLQQFGVSAFSPVMQKYLLDLNGGSASFTRWKANADGIDVNRQYPADWSGIRDVPPYPTYKNYKGTEPAQTEEAKAMMRFTYETDPEIALSYHTSGHIVYWHFHTDPKNVERDRKIAGTISAMTGYSLVKPEPYPSGGGFTDWFIGQFARPGFTVEIGPYQAETELPLWTFADIWKENEKMGLYLASEGYKLWQKRYPVEFVKTELELLDKATLYNKPSEAFSTGGQLPAGRLTSDARMGDWYRVSSWLGPKWIDLAKAPHVQGKIEPFVQKITLTEQTPLYRYPGMPGQQSLGSLNAQEVDAAERWQDWVRVKTWLGDVWLRYKK